MLIVHSDNDFYIHLRECEKDTVSIYILDDLKDGEKTNGEIYCIFGKTERVTESFLIWVCVKSFHDISISFFVFFILYL